jgi:hypothetical protein
MLFLMHIYRNMERPCSLRVIGSIDVGGVSVPTDVARVVLPLARPEDI